MAQPCRRAESGSDMDKVSEFCDAGLVQQLLDRGAKVDAARSQLTPISHAAARGAHEIVELLMEAGAAISAVTSAYLGDRRAVAKSDLVVDEDGTPLLLHAAQSLNAGIARDLLNRGANASATDRFGETALHRVADLRRTAKVHGSALLSGLCLVRCNAGSGWRTASLLDRGPA